MQEAQKDVKRRWLEKGGWRREGKHEERARAVRMRQYEKLRALTNRDECGGGEHEDTHKYMMQWLVRAVGCDTV